MISVLSNSLKYSHGFFLSSNQLFIGKSFSRFNQPLWRFMRYFEIGTWSSSVALSCSSFDIDNGAVQALTAHSFRFQKVAGKITDIPRPATPPGVLSTRVELGI